MKRIVFVCLLMPFMALAQQKKTTKKVPMKAAASSPKASVARGQEVYNTICLSCHQTDGSGVPGLNPPLIKNNWVLGPKNRLIELVLHGSQGRVEIDGETFNNMMPPLGHLTDQEIADVITFVRNSFGNKASAVNRAEVKALRAKSKK